MDGATVIEADKANRPLAALEPRFLEPDGFAWSRFTASDGALLRAGRLAAPSPRGDCVLVGGFTEFAEKYFETMRDLASRGLTVSFLDWRGQGGSVRPLRLPGRPRPRDYDRDAADLIEFIEALPGPRRPRTLVAHSMGGAIALLALERRPALCERLVLSAPMLGIVTGATPPHAAEAIAATARWLGCGLMIPPGARRPSRPPEPANSPTSSDPQRCRLQHAWFAARPELAFAGPTFGWLDTAFRLTHRLRDRRLLGRIATPTLLGSAGIERFVDPAAHRWAAAAMPDCRMVSFPAAKHELFLERDEIRDAWFAEIDRFLGLERVRTVETTA